MSEIQFDQKTQEIVKTYIKIYNAIFKYGIYVIAFFVALILTGSLQTSGATDKLYDITYDESFLGAKKVYDGLQANSIYMENNLNVGKLSVNVLNGYAYTKDGTTFSKNNLITYKGFVLPSSVETQLTDDIKDIKYFDDKNYDPVELNKVIGKFLLVPIQTSYLEKIKNNLIPLNQGNIYSTFGLDCTKSVKIFDYFCNKNLEKFTNEMYKYRIIEDFASFLEIYNNVNSSTKEQICKGAMNNLFYANETTPVLEGFFKNCGEEYANKYKLIKGFNEIQRQIVGIANSSFYDDSNLNMYKLLSLQQLILTDLQNNKIDSDKIFTYLDFVQALLKNGMIKGIYNDMLYIFHNNYLLSMIRNPDIPSNYETAKNIEQIENTIREINHGNTVIGYQGLEKNLMSATLADEISKLQNIDIKKELISFDGLFMNQIGGFENLTIIGKTVDEKNQKVSINGYLKIGNGKTENKMIVYLDYVFAENYFQITKINIPSNDGLAKTINNILSNKNLSLNEVYDIISNNIDLSQLNFDICELFTSSIKDATITKCTKNYLEVQKGMLSYKFLLEDNYNLKDFAVSDQKLYNDLKTQIKDQQTNENTIAGLINFIIDYKNVAPEQTISDSKQLDKLLVNEKFKSFFGIDPTDILENNGKFLIMFTTQDGTKFMGGFFISDNYNVGPVFLVTNKVGAKPIKVNGLTFSLNETDRLKINNFVEDPMGYIKSIDPVAFESYNATLK